MWFKISFEICPSLVTGSNRPGIGRFINMVIKRCRPKYDGRSAETTLPVAEVTDIVGSTYFRGQRISTDTLWQTPALVMEV